MLSVQPLQRHRLERDFIGILAPGLYRSVRRDASDVGERHSMSSELKQTGQRLLTTHMRTYTSRTHTLIVRRTRLSTVGDRAFPVAAAPVWNKLPRHVTSAPSPPSFLVVVWRPTYAAVPFPTFCSTCEVSCVIIGHFSHFCYLHTQTPCVYYDFD